ncbi:MAG TPA: hypothetical protein VK437_04935 [Steroidobacteraceae bacterium]|nr:hypothetical protein [Steroidobacteraceae bacterium]
MDSFVAKLRQLFGAEVANTEGGGLVAGFADCYLPLSVKYAAEYVAMP